MFGVLCLHTHGGGFWYFLVCPLLVYSPYWKRADKGLIYRIRSSKTTWELLQNVALAGHIFMWLGEIEDPGVCWPGLQAPGGEFQTGMIRRRCFPHCPVSPFWAFLPLQSNKEFLPPILAWVLSAEPERRASVQVINFMKYSKEIGVCVCMCLFVGDWE